MTREFPTESTPNNAHSTDIDGQHYDVYKLIQYGNEILPIKMELDDLSENLSHKCWNDLNKKRFSPINMLDSFQELGSWEAVKDARPEWADHIEKVKSADYSYPILTYKFEMIDGMHRLVKACIEKAGDIYVRVIDKLPENTIYSLQD